MLYSGGLIWNKRRWHADIKASLIYNNNGQNFTLILLTPESYKWWLKWREWLEQKANRLPSWIFNDIGSVIKPQTDPKTKTFEAMCVLLDGATEHFENLSCNSFENHFKQPITHWIVLQLQIALACLLQPCFSSVSNDESATKDWFFSPLVATLPVWGC